MCIRDRGAAVRAARRPGQVERGLADRARRFRQGLRGAAGDPVDQAHPGPHESRRRVGVRCRRLGEDDPSRRPGTVRGVARARTGADRRQPRRLNARPGREGSWTLQQDGSDRPGKPTGQADHLVQGDLACCPGHLTCCPRRPHSSPRPVSYTHLDVYKRQVLAAATAEVALA